MVGAPASPYSRKLRAVLRYRRLPHVFVIEGSPEAASIPKARVHLLPRLIFEGEARTDTTPLIRSLETIGPQERTVIPDDPSLAWLDALIEDYADEWGTKMMFHYRWAFPDDAAKAAKLLPLQAHPQLEEAALRTLSAGFRDRQERRRALVGSTPETASVIESSYRNLLGILQTHLATHRFLLGDRPGAGDFALYGQLSQLVLFDPTSAALALAEAPRVVAWTEQVEDLSGVEPGVWGDCGTVAETLRPLLFEIGSTYAPFLRANARALETGAERVELTLGDRSYVQAPFGYQSKCLKALRDAYAELPTEGRAAVDATLEGTGCEVLIG